MFSVCLNDDQLDLAFQMMVHDDPGDPDPGDGPSNANNPEVAITDDPNGLKKKSSLKLKTESTKQIKRRKKKTRISRLKKMKFMLEK